MLLAVQYFSIKFDFSNRKKQQQHNNRLSLECDIHWGIPINSKLITINGGGVPIMCVISILKQANIDSTWSNLL